MILDHQVFQEPHDSVLSQKKEKKEKELATRNKVDNDTEKRINFFFLEGGGELSTEDSRTLTFRAVVTLQHQLVIILPPARLNGFNFSTSSTHTVVVKLASSG